MSFYHAVLRDANKWIKDENYDLNSSEELILDSHGQRTAICGAFVSVMGKHLYFT